MSLRTILVVNLYVLFLYDSRKWFNKQTLCYKTALKSIVQEALCQSLALNPGWTSDIETNVPVHPVLAWEAGIARETRCRILHAASVPNWLYLSVAMEVLQPVSRFSSPASLPPMPSYPEGRELLLVEMPLAERADIFVSASSSNDHSSFSWTLLLSVLTSWTFSSVPAPKRLLVW